MTSPYPCLWFDGKAREAAEFYCGIFPNAAILQDNGMVVVFELNGTMFMGLNGGPQFTFSEAVSFVIRCNSQEEIDHYWYNLIVGGGQESMCGWLKDRYGLSWQVVPSMIGELMSDPEKGQRVMQEILQMKKIDLYKLLSA